MAINSFILSQTNGSIRSIQTKNISFHTSKPFRVCPSKTSRLISKLIQKILQPLLKLLNNTFFSLSTLSSSCGLIIICIILSMLSIGIRLYRRISIISLGFPSFLKNNFNSSFFFFPLSIISLQHRFKYNLFKITNLIICLLIREISIIGRSLWSRIRRIFIRSIIIHQSNHILKTTEKLLCDIKSILLEILHYIIQCGFILVISIIIQIIGIHFKLLRKSFDILVSFCNIIRNRRSILFECRQITIQRHHNRLIIIFNESALCSIEIHRIGIS